MMRASLRRQLQEELALRRAARELIWRSYCSAPTPSTPTFTFAGKEGVLVSRCCRCRQVHRATQPLQLDPPAASCSRVNLAAEFGMPPPTAEGSRYQVRPMELPMVHSCISTCPTNPPTSAATRSAGPGFRPQRPGHLPGASASQFCAGYRCLQR